MQNLASKSFLISDKRTQINGWVCTQNGLGIDSRVAGAGSVTEELLEKSGSETSLALVRFCRPVAQLSVSFRAVKQLLRSCSLCGSDGDAAGERSVAAPPSACGGRRRPASWRPSGSW